MLAGRAGRAVVVSAWGGNWGGPVGWAGGGGGLGGGWGGLVGWPGGAGGLAVGGAGWVYARPATGGYVPRGGGGCWLAGGVGWSCGGGLVRAENQPSSPGRGFLCQGGRVSHPPQ